MQDRAAGLILAAGASTRMGKPKQLLPVQGTTLLERVITEALNSLLNKVFLILGYRAEEIKNALSGVLLNKKLKIIENKAYAQGISTSIIAGVSEVADTYDHVMLLLADMPCINARLIDLLLRRYLDSHLPLGAIQIKSKRSHPVIFSRRLYPELMELRGDVGGRALFRKYRDQACLVDPGFSYDDSDIDTPEDYADFNTSLARRIADSDDDTKY
jgi:molybdenum cofactor cytidylyltransferase